MTYCLAWRTEAHAFLIADSAVTSSLAPELSHTSFGEAHVVDAVNNVEEGALKIIPVGNGAVAFAGPARIGNSFVRVLRSRIDSGQTYEDAFQSAVDSHTPFTLGNSLAVLIAYQTDWKPKLRSFNAYNDCRIVEHSANTTVQIGSISNTHFSELSDEYTRYLIEQKMGGAQSSLVCAMALCQLYAIHNNLMQFGVGGTFSGGVVAGNGFHWQQDIAYFLLDPHSTDPQVPEQSVLTAVREDVLVVRSTVAEGPPRAFTSRRPLETSARSRERTHRANELALKDLSKAQFQYIVLLNTRLPSAVIVSMLGKNMHRLLSIETWNEVSEPTLFRCAIAEPLMIMLRDVYDLVYEATSRAGTRKNPAISYCAYSDPHFDIELQQFEVEFFHDTGVKPEVIPGVMAAFQANKHQAGIFIQNRDGQQVAALALLGWYLKEIGRDLEEDYIPESIRRPEGGSAVVPVRIDFPRGLFHMMTNIGPAEMKRLTLYIEVNWLPETASPN